MRSILDGGKNQITILGARGSMPVSGPQYHIFGGATSCVLLETPELAIVLDAGSGLLKLGQYTEENHSATKKKKLPVFLSHFHLDHIMGLPLGRFLFDAGAEVVFYTPDFLQEPQTAIREMMKSPLWPVGPEVFRAKIEFCRLGKERYRLPDSSVYVCTMPVAHPNGCGAYRFEWDDKSLVYATDCELDEEGIAKLADFAKDAGLLILDAQYTKDEYERFQGFGHSSMDVSVELVQRGGISRCLLFHHAPEHTDDQLMEMERLLQRRCPQIEAAREGSVITL